MKSKEKLTYIKILDETNTWETSEGDSPEVEWGNRPDTDTSHTIGGFEIVEDEKRHGWDLAVSFEINPTQTYYFLYVLYGSGDSFGHDGGNIEYIGLYEDRALAEANAVKINEHAKKNKNTCDDNTFSVELIAPNGEPFRLSTPWNGYFESIEDIIVEPLSLANSKRSFLTDRWEY